MSEATQSTAKEPNKTEKAVKNSYAVIMGEIQNLHKLANSSDEGVRRSYRSKFLKNINEELSNALDRLDGKKSDLF